MSNEPPQPPPADETGPEGSPDEQADSPAGDRLLKPLRREPQPSSLPWWLTDWEIENAIDAYLDPFGGDPEGD